MRPADFAVCAAVLSLSLGGCATVTRGSTEEFKIRSTPPGASVKTSTGFSCDATPCSLKLPRKNAFDVTVSKQGYTAQTVHVRSAVSGGGAAGMAGNLVAGGIIGMAVDGSSGAMDDLLPNPVDVTLEAAGTAQASAPATPADAAASTGISETKTAAKE